MQPFYFGPSEERLFGVFHPPALQTSRDYGVVLCPPLEHEFYNAHRCLRQLAQALSDDGLPVLRFDYRGTGDSSGAWEEASVSQWLDDIDCAVAELLARGNRRVCLAGLRFGGTLATLFSAESGRADALVLWEPVARGAEYLSELESQHRQETGGTGAVDDGRQELLGFEYDDSLRGEISQIDLSALRQKPACDVLLLKSAGLPEEHLQIVEGRLDHFETPPVTHFWRNLPSQAMLPRQIPQRVSSWLAGLCR